MEKLTLKIYLYEMICNDRNKRNMEIYAFNKKESEIILNKMIDKGMFKGGCFIKTKLSKTDKDRLQRYIEKFGGPDMIVEKELEIINNYNKKRA